MERVLRPNVLSSPGSIWHGYPVHSEVKHESQCPIVSPERPGRGRLLQAAVDFAQFPQHGLDHDSPGHAGFVLELRLDVTGRALGSDQPVLDAPAGFIQQWLDDATPA
jgi:hypothetical protein